MGGIDMFLPVEKEKQECTYEMAYALCTDLYKVLEPKGYYPALTGGLLYKEGKRKDIDIIIYRNRQKVSSFETVDIAHLLAEVNLNITASFGFVTKAEWFGMIVDIFNPETNDEVFNKWYESQRVESAEIKADFIKF
jgi:hypothetical protein